MDIIIKNIRLSFPQLFSAKEFKPGDGKPRWSAAFIVPEGSEADKAIRGAIRVAAEETWGVNAEKMLKSVEGQKTQYCYLNGGNKGFEGAWVLSTHRSAKLARPQIIDADKSPLTAEDGRPYAGCYVNARVGIWCQKGENPGVRASFDVIQFARDGDAFGAAPPSTDDFDDVTSGAAASDFM